MDQGLRRGDCTQADLADEEASRYLFMMWPPNESCKKMFHLPENCAELSFAAFTQSILVTDLGLQAAHSLDWDNGFLTMQ